MIRALLTTALELGQLRQLKEDQLEPLMRLRAHWQASKQKVDRAVLTSTYTEEAALNRQVVAPVACVTAGISTQQRRVRHGTQEG